MSFSELLFYIKEKRQLQELLLEKLDQQKGLTPEIDDLLGQINDLRRKINELKDKTITKNN
jgi:peptidoglycan hydrolase CwlO-like protein